MTNDHITPKVGDVLKWKTRDSEDHSILWAVIRIVKIKNRKHTDDLKAKAIVIQSNYLNIGIQPFWWKHFKSGSWSYYKRTNRIQIYDELKRMLTE